MQKVLKERERDECGYKTKEGTLTEERVKCWFRVFTLAPEGIEAAPVLKAGNDVNTVTCLLVLREKRTPHVVVPTFFPPVGPEGIASF